MMRFTVTWHPEAENELTELWLLATDREDITAAVQAIDIALATDASARGETVAEVTPSPNPDPGLMRESSCPDWGWKGFSDEEATQYRADRGLASAG